MSDERPENNETVWHIQKRLREKGYDIAADGDLGPPTFWDESETLKAVLADLGGPVALPPPVPHAASATGKRVYIDIGHGPKPDRFDPGAVNAGSGITEHQLNTVAGRACADALRARGLKVKVDDGKRHNYSAGKAAAGHDVFVSIHHNSAAGKAQGSEALIHAAKGGEADRRLARLAAEAMAGELGITNRGAKSAALSVLSGAGDAGVPAAILAELYFIQRQDPPYPPPGDMTIWSHRAGQALGGAIADYLGA